MQVSRAHSCGCIAGETVVVQGKNKDDKVIENWNAPLIIAGNESIAMKAGKDAGGRMSRRIIPFAFQRKVEHKDRTLLSQIQKDMAAIIHCCTWGFKVRYRRQQPSAAVH